MTQGQFPEAVAAFSRALDASGDDPDYVLARGVAETLAEQFHPAMKDLERYQRLGGKGREAELWTYVAEAMSGIATPGHAIPGPRTSRAGKANLRIPSKGRHTALFQYLAI